LGFATKTARIDAPANWSNARLIKECLKGNESAWATLIDKYKGLIFSIPVRYGFSQEDSADIFQAVCMDLLLELPRIREPDALAGWLIQVTRNKCFHRKREQLQRPTAEMDENAADSAESMDSIIAQVQQEQLLREALHELSPRCQELVRLLFFESPVRPYQEVAEQLGLATGSIGLVRRRCLETLRRQLEILGF